MAHWDDENFNNQTPPDNILCRTCKLKLKSVEVAGYVQERWNFGTCGAYEDKPQDILWGRSPCQYYEEENGN